MENEEQIIERNWFERFVLWCMNLILKPAGKKLEGQAADGFLQFVKFALVGVTNTVISYFINAGTLYVLGAFDLFPNTDIYIGNTVAFILSVLWAYMLSNKFVFVEDENKEKRVWWKTLLKTYAAYAFTGLGLSNLISYVGVNIFHLSKYIPPIINLFISVPINFILNKFWAYRQKKGDDDEPETEPA
ncbi:MAG: GtrA family protein [Clostridiales bacterium]|nr:GtrA family protein [Clostridiales bacterium]